MSSATDLKARLDFNKKAGERSSPYDEDLDFLRRGVLQTPDVSVNFYELKTKNSLCFSLLFQAETLKAQKVGRVLVFSADMGYNGANEMPLPLGEVAAKPTERVRLWNETPSHPLSRELSQRESLKTRATLGVWA